MKLALPGIKIYAGQKIEGGAGFLTGGGTKFCLEELSFQF